MLIFFLNEEEMQIVYRNNFKSWFLTRKRPEFEPGIAEASQFEKLKRCRQVSNPAAANAVKNQLLKSFRYIATEVFSSFSYIYMN
jgi:hypothetical protein